MSNLITLGRKALIARLETITQENGYRTDAGNNVRSGWFSEQVAAADASFPIIVVQRGKDQAPRFAGHGMRKLHGYAVVAGVEAGLDDYEDALDDLELDLLQCLMPIEAVPCEWTPEGIPHVTLGISETVPPGDGLKAVTIVIPIYLHTFIESRCD